MEEIEARVSASAASYTNLLLIFEHTQVLNFIQILPNIVFYHHQVRELAHSIDDGLEVVTCGSYRRGKPTCGDVDILVTHPDGRSHRGVFGQLLEKGRQEGFLTDDLSVHNDPEGQSKYLGVCKLGEERKVEYGSVCMCVCVCARTNMVNILIME